MDCANKCIGVRGDDRERSDPFLGAGSPPVLPKARQGERLSALHADGIRLLWHSWFESLPLRKVVNRNKAAAVAIRVPEAWKLRHRFGLRVDRPFPAILVSTPVGNQTPPQPIKDSLACLRILTNDPVLLTGRSVISRRRGRWLGSDSRS